MVHRFQEKSLFALIAVNNAYTDLPDQHFRLSDETWILPRVPDAGGLSTWKTWLGSLRLERLHRANLVLLVEKPSEIPEILGAGHQHLSHDLGLLYWMLHLGFGIEIFDDTGADRLVGSSVGGVAEVRQVDQMPTFCRSRGSPKVPITRNWLEDSLLLRASFVEMEAKKTQFRRLIRGMSTLFKGLREETGQDRLHQFVRSLEALILPQKGRTRRQFAHRCQTFTCAGVDISALLLEAFDMRSATEHLNRWDEPVRSYSVSEREEVCWKRTRQIERLACDAYSRLLRDRDLRKHFRTDDEIERFWKLPYSQRCELWGTPLDIEQDLAVGTD